ncbi:MULTISPECIES: DMT family transporter [Lysinibacillus]|jgi:multidrug resistance protein EbrB|uniref:QacE family quaternary ammonium compound efflux SMR transporter n=1 Tax=Lysinibacillus fusiformis TaxID=28031 RepID=A0A2I0UY49_9BACI|nr:MULTISPECIES: multidrug efflux SMR transporter [Lysinibacillus]KUF29783.1 multidrug transporter [Lysinibacillus sp. F5]MEE3809645.1 multidrug efflux SMR transporter [Lysinibacillus fusiformis]PKU50994.1 QacE family quaternary ammonium compound efflux SMR transporter [Lysinibacillus fusiformis]WCH49429.1 multidrug efflux SMR transporter [Lysinibacillus sp. OF-1]SCY18059.1 multidrug resistance protein EbrB [Lysinibacillus sp. SG9]
MKGYLFLTLSIISEVFATTMLKLSEGFTVLGPSLAVALGYGISFYSLSLCLKTLPLSLAYAIWSGVGTALTVLVGMIIWHDMFNLYSALGIALIIGGVILLNQGDKRDKVMDSLQE